MSDDVGEKLRWRRDRNWIDEEMATHAGVDSDYSRGYLMAMMKVYGRMFLTDDEQRKVEQARREMFG